MVTLRVYIKKGGGGGGGLHPRGVKAKCQPMKYENCFSLTLCPTGSLKLLCLHS